MKIECVEWLSTRLKTVQKPKIVIVFHKILAQAQTVETRLLLQLYGLGTKLASDQELICQISLPVVRFTVIYM